VSGTFEVCTLTMSTQNLSAFLMGIVVLEQLGMVGKAVRWMESIGRRWVTMLMSECVTMKNSFDY